MAYLLIVREPRGQRAGRSEAEGRETYDAMVKFGEGLAKRGILVAAESLSDDSSGVRVSIRDGRTRLVDGPFTESKEMVGGFFLLDVGSREEAVEIASQCPAARFATVEVRELAPCYQR
ncbi:MAG: dehydrogenase [Ectothiorhodospiraceae bacterium]|nr:dehydrogenase [Ectothiorhodospiraceae bacterium]